MFRREQEVYYKGEKISLEALIKKFRPKRKHLVIISNSEEVVAEAKKYFQGFTVLAEVYQKVFPISEPALEMIIKQILQKITYDTHQGDMIVFVFSAPCIIQALLAKRLSKSTRHILFAQLESYKKIYHLYEIDKP